MSKFEKRMSDKMKRHNPNNVSSAVGMAWYTRSAYPLCLAIFSDAADYPDTFDEWLTKAEQTEKKLRQQGVRVIRAEIDPNTFPSWCAANGFSNVDTQARCHYANLKAAESLGIKPKL